MKLPRILIRGSQVYELPNQVLSSDVQRLFKDRHNQKIRRVSWAEQNRLSGNAIITIRRTASFRDMRGEEIRARDRNMNGGDN